MPPEQEQSYIDHRSILEFASEDEQDEEADDPLDPLLELQVGSDTDDDADDVQQQAPGRRKESLDDVPRQYKRARLDTRIDIDSMPTEA